MINKLQKIVIGTDEADEKKNFLWNMIGSGIFALGSMVLSYLTIRIMGEDQGGVFSIAITISQMMAFIVYYETRTFQVTDVKDIYQFGHYKATKLILCVVMMAACVIYMWFREGNFGEKTIVILLMCVYRMVDAYADLYEGSFQKDGRLYLTGKSQAFRTVLSVVVIMVVMLLTHRMIFSVLMGIVAAIAGLYLFDIVIMKAFRSISPVFDKEKITGILKDCFPLFVGAFLWTYILSASRIAIDGNMSSNYQSYYQALFMPISVINLCATFVLKPALPALAEKYGAGRLKGFFVQIMKISALIVVFAIICMAGAYLIGIPVLSLLSGCDLSEYRGVLVFLMLAGGVNSLSYFMYYILTVMRKTKCVFIGYVSASVLAAIISGIFVRANGIMGAAQSFLVVVLYLLVIFTVFIAAGIREKLR